MKNMMRFLAYGERLNVKYWPRLIENAKARGYFTNEEIEEARKWDTCAVGKCLPTPASRYCNLTGLGEEFSEAIRNHWFDKALTIHDEISGIL